MPYGDKSSIQIREIAEEVVNWLCAQEVSALVMACNTTNSLAFDVVHRCSRVPVFGLIDAATEMVTKSRVGVLATSATVSSGSYRKHIQASRPGTFVLEKACPDFVPLIEAGDFSSEQLHYRAGEYLKPLLAAKVEEVVLGCTHYPILSPLLRQFLPENVRLIDPSIVLATKLDFLLGRPIGFEKRPFSLDGTRICVTSDPSGFASRASRFLGAHPDVEQINLRSKACFF